MTAPQFPIGHKITLTGTTRQLTKSNLHCKVIGSYWISEGTEGYAVSGWYYSLRDMNTGATYGPIPEDRL